MRFLFISSAFNRKRDASSSMFGVRLPWHLALVPVAEGAAWVAFIVGVC